MSELRDNGPYRPGAPDPTVLTRLESEKLEERLRREYSEKITALSVLHDQRFNLIGDQIDQYHTLFGAQLDQYRMMAKEALDSRLLSQKEAVAKAEISTENQLKALDRRISEIKERLDTGEGATRGSTDTRSDRRADIGTFAAISGLILGIINVVIIIIFAIIALPHAPAVPVTVEPSHNLVPSISGSH